MSLLIKLLKRNQPSFYVRTSTKHGVLLDLDPTDYIDSVVIRSGYYEEEVLKALRANLHEDDVFWDVGANIGLHSITLKQQLPRLRVVCFEPSPFAFFRLHRNLTLNALDVSLFNIGLADVARYAQFSLYMNVNSGASSFNPQPKSRPQYSMACYCDTAVELIRRGLAPMPTVMKLDVENFEYQVLAGFGDLLANPQLKAIVFESLPDVLTRQDIYPVHALLAKAGFHIEPLTPLNLAVKSVPTNFLAKR